ncbi:hypothetical protein DSM106972_032350 [Dulcicalothrix desertica PCC 7102]|uniref:Spore coat protein U domain-containing protein n=1 Tax=Dulcicalothrix desertica PCC 7102 TaxID=232991 RepID=A0A3S1J1E5_9CYAN|nr:hypothetical protein [Dulcicalothrix desertica]RUT06029.1 hypothetical protein DSM106972_032350 [Dulcicalothrix desertica PCC 7102]TWH54305.1 hypothetical protein CAL7102_02324 [Dulcicalothrix desertica PCC 7102]
MIRYLLLSFAFMLIHCTIFTKSVNADEGSAAGDVPVNCTFSNSVDGQLGINQDGTVLSSSSSVDDGAPASLEIDCSADATLTISEPVRSGGNGATTFLSDNLSARATATLVSMDTEESLPDINIESGKPGSNIPGNSLGTIKINMEARHSEKILPGKYSFTVTITATP